MAITLTDQQLAILDGSGESPARVVDPRTNAHLCWFLCRVTNRSARFSRIKNCKPVFVGGHA
jgi:hypothetical protein